MPSEDQSAASKMSLVVTPTPAAVEHDPPLTECAFSIEMSILASGLPSSNYAARNWSMFTGQMTVSSAKLGRKSLPQVLMTYSVWISGLVERSPHLLYRILSVSLT